MSRKYLSLGLIGLLLNLTFYSTAMATAQTDAKLAEKVKANIARIGTGYDGKVEITLKDGTKLKGYVSEIKSSGFFVIDEKTSATAEIQYLQVKEVNQINRKKVSVAGVIVKFVLIIGLFAVLGGGLSSDY